MLINTLSIFELNRGKVASMRKVFLASALFIGSLNVFGAEDSSKQMIVLEGEEGSWIGVGFPDDSNEFLPAGTEIPLEETQTSRDGKFLQTFRLTRILRGNKESEFKNPYYNYVLVSETELEHPINRTVERNEDSHNDLEMVTFVLDTNSQI